jgi:hypothetical protein
MLANAFFPTPEISTGIFIGHFDPPTPNYDGFGPGTPTAVTFDVPTPA